MSSALLAPIKIQEKNSLSESCKTKSSNFEDYFVQIHESSLAAALHSAGLCRSKGEAAR